MLDAIIAAGGDPEKDAALLAHAGNVPHKALIELDGQTSLERVVSALLGSGRIGRIAVVGLSPELCPDLGPRVTFLPDAGDMLENGEAGVAYFRSTGGVSERIVGSACDIPLITAEIVSGLIDQCLPYDVDFCYSIVSREVMEQAFPGSGRSFIPMADGWFAGGDIVVAKPGMLDSDKQKWRALIGGRKTVWKQVRVIGLGTLFLFAIRRLTIAGAERRASRALGLTGKAIISPYAEVAMDVDKPHHLDAVRAALVRQETGVQSG